MTGPQEKPTTLDRAKAEISKAAHFYLSHRMREYPHPDAPDITMAEHVSDDEDCPGCNAEDLLEALVAVARAAREWYEEDHYPGGGRMRRKQAVGEALARLDGTS